MGDTQVLILGVRGLKSWKMVQDRYTLDDQHGERRFKVYE